MRLMTTLLLLTAALGRPPADPPDARVLSALGGDPTAASLFAFCSAFASAGAGTLPPAQVRRACKLCGSETCPTPAAAAHDDDDDVSLSRRHEADLLLAGKLEREGDAAAGRHASISGALHAIDNATRLDGSNRSNGTGDAVAVGNGSGAQHRPPSPPPAPPSPPSPSLMARLRANMYANMQTSAEILQGQRALEEGVALVVSEGVVLALMVLALCCCCVLRATKRI